MKKIISLTFLFLLFYYICFDLLNLNYMKRPINYRFVSIASKITLWIGVAVILTSVVYAISNLTSIDNFITIWTALMAIGVCFSFISILLYKMVK